MLRPLFVAVLLAGLSGQALAKTDLLTVYQEALLNSADLAAAAADSLARQEALPQARALLLPSIGLGAGAAREHFEIDGVGSDEYTTQYYQASLVQPLFRAESWFNYQAAKSLSEQARVEFSAAQQDLILEVAQTYFNVLRASDNLAAARSEEQAFERQLEQARERFEVGLSARTDVLEALAGFDTARAARLTAQTNLDVSYQALTRLTNQEYAELIGISHDLPVLPPIPADLQEWVTTAAVQNLQLQASRLAIDTAQETLHSNKAGYAPTVDAFVRHNANFGGADARPGSGVSSAGRIALDTELTTFGVEVSMPLFTGGATTSRVRESDYRLTQAEQLSEAQLRRVVETTRNLYRTVTSSVEEVEARRQAIISANAALDATQTGYEVGTRNVVDVLQAQRNLYRSVRDYNNIRYNYIIDNLSLKQAAGTLSPEDLQDLSRWLNPDYDPDEDFIPPFNEEDVRRMSMGRQESLSAEQARLRKSF
ncbi:MAG TPA: channel protein TolC [Pseudomonas xinjiangensis]|uniref:Channel protein TolC n=2 Tax=root TaxID=1 RepID=A0A7V1BQJ2_9GAMM|nr:channel protein TolC [Halopseudomonas xinjiangensis]HEC49487.1 channel protein TolC [Halopseudomonas xinjiangensis]